MKETIKAAFVNAGRMTFYNQKFVILLWATNSILAVIMTLPITNMLFDNLKNSLMSNRLAMGFDYVWYIQFSEIYKMSISQLPDLLFGVVVIYVLINTFYAGGLISIFSSPAKNHFIDFFYGGLKYWLRFMKVVMISGLLYITAFLLNHFIGNLIAYMFSGTEMAWTDFSLRFLRYIYLLFMIGIVSIVSDYTKVLLASEDRHDVFGAIYDSAKFIVKNFNIVFTVFFIVALLGGLGALLYNIIDMGIPRTPYYFLILSFILQQMLVIFRLNIKMFFYSTEVTLYKDLKAEEIDPREVVVTTE